MTVEFCDTNILLYAEDATAPFTKRESARILVERLWETRAGWISTQVPQEFYVNFLRKTGNAELARDRTEPYLCWNCSVIEPDEVLEAIHHSQRYQISLWDASWWRRPKRLGPPSFGQRT